MTLDRDDIVLLAPFALSVLLLVFVVGGAVGTCNASNRPPPGCAERVWPASNGLTCEPGQRLVVGGGVAICRCPAAIDAGAR